MWNFLFEEHQGGNDVDTVFFGFVVVIDFNKHYVILVTFIVDVFEFS